LAENARPIATNDLHDKSTGFPTEIAAKYVNTEELIERRAKRSFQANLNMYLFISNDFNKK
jgi:hypothetical protein